MVAKTAENYSGASTNHFPPFLKGVKGDFLKLGIWILFDICNLVLGVLDIPRHLYV